MLATTPKQPGSMMEFGLDGWAVGPPCPIGDATGVVGVPAEPGGLTELLPVGRLPL